MLQGRDGIGAAPCCGTGVVFSRTALVSIGGQAYGSITEDYNTSLTLFAAGFSSMFLNERLVYGMAPEDLVEVFQQRRRWAMGALQILFIDNPLCKPGLTVAQSLLFFEAAAYHFLAIPTIILTIVPFLFVFLELAPIVAFKFWEFAAAFGTFFVFNRLAIYVVSRGIKGADNELWRGWQMWIWMAPNHVISIFTVLIREIPILKLFTRKKKIKFQVTSKVSSIGNLQETETTKSKETWRAFFRTLSVTWYFILYYLTFAAALTYAIVNCELLRAEHVLSRFRVSFLYLPQLRVLNKIVLLTTSLSLSFFLYCSCKTSPNVDLCNEHCCSGLGIPQLRMHLASCQHVVASHRDCPWLAHRMASAFQIEIRKLRFPQIIFWEDLFDRHKQS